MIRLYHSERLTELQTIYGLINKNTKGILSDYVKAISEDKNPKNTTCHEVMRKMVECGALTKVGSEDRTGRVRELYTVNHEILYSIIKEDPLIKMLFEMFESEEWVL